jgi:hypothetical protein
LEFKGLFSTFALLDIFKMSDEIEITMGDVNGTTHTLPDKKIIRDAQENKLLNTSFWFKIQAGKIPYIFSKEKNELVEATYEEMVDEITTNKYEIFWLTDEEYPSANETCKNAEGLLWQAKEMKKEINKNN